MLVRRTSQHLGLEAAISRAAPKARKPTFRKEKTEKQRKEKIEKDKERDMCVDIDIILCIQSCGWMCCATFCRVVFCEQSYLFPFMVILSLRA